IAARTASGPRTRSPPCRPAPRPWTSCSSRACSKTSAGTPTRSSRSWRRPGRTLRWTGNSPRSRPSWARAKRRRRSPRADGAAAPGWRRAAPGVLAAAGAGQPRPPLVGVPRNPARRHPLCRGSPARRHRAGPQGLLDDLLRVPCRTAGTGAGRPGHRGVRRVPARHGRQGPARRVVTHHATGVPGGARHRQHRSAAGRGRRAARILGPVAAGADPTGRPLFAANVAVVPPDDALGRLWQLATTLREHRGDGHIAAMVSEGITGLEAHLLQAAAGRFPQAVIRQVRGWSEEQGAAATDALCTRGLLTTDGATDADGATGPAPGAEPATAAADGVLGLTPAGRAVLDTIEAHTDERAWTGGLTALGERGVEEVLALLRPSVRAVVASGMLPPVNPTGLNPASAAGGRPR